jgi:gamma-glutamyltranspeptidase/glutathione hydrolase
MVVWLGAVAEALRACGHEVVVAEPGDLKFGGAQVVTRLQHGYLAASDPRRDGLPTGF